MVARAKHLAPTAPRRDAPPKRGQTYRSSDPLARALFWLLRDRPEVDRRFVLRELSGRERGLASERAQLVEDSIRRFVAETGRSDASYRSYEAWRKEQDDPTLLSGSAIVRRYRGWASAMESLGLRPRADVTSLAIRAAGKGITDQEIIEALRACATAIGRGEITFAEYRAWAERELASEDQAVPVIPLSRKTIARFGSFRLGLAAAGLIEDDEAGTIPRKSIADYSEAEILEAVRQASREARGQLTWLGYVRWRRERLAGSGSREPARALPAAETVRDHLGTWREALLKAGVVSREEAEMLARVGSAEPLSAEFVSAHLLAAVRDGGPNLTRPAYRRWRAKQPRVLGRPRPPVDRTVASRFGGNWRRAVRAAASAPREDPVAWIVGQMGPGGHEA